jgi:WD40 repeat protein
VKFSPLRKNHLLSGSNDGSITVWDVSTRDSIANFPCSHQSKVTALASSVYNENLICSSGIDQKVIFYDIAKKGFIFIYTYTYIV